MASWFAKLSGVLSSQSLCEVCNPARYNEPDWMRMHQTLEQYSAENKHVFQHTNGGHVYRKGWEWTHCAYGLEELGVLSPQARGLGVGAGRECLIFFFADRVREVVALDLYGNKLWSALAGREASLDIVKHTDRFNPRGVDLHKIRFVNGSGTDLSVVEGTFDFCWSMSSIEHFGGHQAAARAMQEMARVTKPGGIVAIATEYLLLPEYNHVEYFNRDDIRTHLIDSVPELELVSEINWNTLSPEYLVDSILFPHAVDRVRRHVVLNDGVVQWTSVALFFRRRNSR
jgi:SAM-dependent methyltransferase